MYTRRNWVKTMMLGGTAMLVLPGCSTASARPSIKVYKESTCSCCTKWVDHLKQNGFDVQTEDVASIDDIKRQLAIPRDLESCHTATLEGYQIEGHVPADLIHKLLREKPKAAGLAVPGMPVGSPGMEEDGSRKEPYAVLLFQRDGSTEVYANR